MATEQEVFELVYKYIGEAEAKRLQDHLDQQRQKSAALQGQLDAMNAASQTTVAKVETEAEARKRMTQALADEEKATARYIQTVQREAEAVEKAAKRQEEAAARAARKIGDGTNVARQGFVDISRASQDFVQGGFSAIVNNLEGIGRGLPAILKNPMALLSSLPSMLTLVGVALLAFGPKIGEFIKSLNPNPIRDFTTQIEQLTKHIEELKGKSIKLAIDVREIDIAEKRLQRFKDAQAEFDANAKKPSVSQAESGKAIDELIGESKTGMPEIQKRMAAKFEAQFNADDPTIKEARKSQARYRDQLSKEQDGDAIIALNELIKDAEKVVGQAKGANKVNAPLAVGDLLKQAKDGNVDQAGAQERLRDALEGIGEDDLAKGVGALSPAAMKAAKDAHEKQKKGLESIARSKAGDTAAANLGKQAAEQGLNPEAAFKFITDELKKIFAAELAKRGAAPPPGLEKTKEGKAAAEELDSAINQLAERGLDKSKTERDKADDADRKQKLKVLTQSDAFDTAADQLVRAIAARGLAPEEEFAEIRDQLVNAITKKLQDQGVDTEAPDSAEAIGTAAAGVTDRAFTRSGRAAAKDATAADQEATRIATDFAKTLRDSVLQEIRKAIGDGRSWDQVQAIVVQRAAAAMTAGGVQAPFIGPASKKTAVDLVREARAEIGAETAEQPAQAEPKAKLTPAQARQARAQDKAEAAWVATAWKAKERRDRLARNKAATNARLHPKPEGKPAAPPAKTPEQQAARKLAEEEEAKKEKKQDAADRDKTKQRRDAQVKQIAGNIQAMSPQIEGFRFTPQQAKKAAEESVKAMEAGANADEAILRAMDGVLENMAKLGNRFAAVQLMAVRNQRGNAQLGFHIDQMQPAAANSGGGGS